MNGLWGWLQQNAEVLQAIAACATFGLALFTTWVLVVTYRAARLQADAAKKQADAGERQILFLKQQTTAARRQLEESVRPMLFLPAACSALPSLTKVEIQNLGSGPAMEITCAYARFGDKKIEEQWVVPGTIVKGESFPFVIDPDRVRKDGLVFLYQSLAGTSCVSEVTDQRPHFRYIADAREWVKSLRSPR